MKKVFNIIPFIFTVAMLVLGACDEDPTDDLYDIIKDDLGYTPKITQFKLVTPTTSPVPAQSTITFDLRFFSEGEISGIKFYKIVGTDTALISEQPYAPAYSKVTKTDSLMFNYSLPASLTSGTNFSVQARVAGTGRLETHPTISSVALRVQ